MVPSGEEEEDDSPYSAQGVSRIFRNQPPSSYYDFEFGPHSALFRTLNDLEDSDIEDLDDAAAWPPYTPIVRPEDPRTKREVKADDWDYSVNPMAARDIKMLKSTLSSTEHKQLLEYTMTGHVANSDFPKLLARRTEEVKKFHEYATWLTNRVYYKERMYKPATKLRDIYREWYSDQVENIQQSYNGGVTFNVYTALPLARLCMNSNRCQSTEGSSLFISYAEPQILNTQLLDAQGIFPTTSAGKYDSIEFSNTRWKMDAVDATDCVKTLVNDSIPLSIVEKHMKLMANTEEEEEEQEKEDDGKRLKLFASLDTLLFLLTAGEYQDIPSEVLLEIREDNKGGKFLVFGKPFPASNTGWHTHHSAFEKAFAAFTPNEYTPSKMDMSTKKFVQIHQTPEIQAGSSENEIEYSLKEFDDYVSNVNSTEEASDISSRGRSNELLFKWQLGCDVTNQKLNILTNLSLPAIEEDNSEEGTTTRHRLQTFKIQYKPEFGCEIMTKYELLKNWFQLYFFGELNQLEASENYGFCYHLAARDFSIQLKQKIDLKQIEKDLKSYYKIDINNLLLNLMDFIYMLERIPCGDFLLRYSFHTPNQLLLYAPSTEIFTKTIHMYKDFISSCASDLLFMVGTNYIPIHEDLVSAVHLQNSIMPCTFHPEGKFDSITKIWGYPKPQTARKPQQKKTTKNTKKANNSKKKRKKKKKKNQKKKQTEN